MKVVECSGKPREVGQQTGEALRDEIRCCLEMWSRVEENEWAKRLPIYVEVMRKDLPDVLDEMQGMAEGADVAPEEIYLLNFPKYPDELGMGEGCTNVVFAAGPDGPIWGKNNDGGPPGKQLPVSARVIRPAKGIPVVEFPFCGMVGVGDGMNAEGVALGHSSVGSMFQRSDRHLPIRPWSHHALQHCRTAAELVEVMASRPLRGKGYSYVCVDRNGSMCSIEAPCPLLQVRHSENPRGAFCVNCYLLPALAQADRRNAQGKDDALRRKAFIEKELEKDLPTGLERMKSMLRSHGEPASLCRHGGKDSSHTEYSVIGLPGQNRVLFYHGNPCRGEYEEIRM